MHSGSPASIALPAVPIGLRMHAVPSDFAEGSVHPVDGPTDERLRRNHHRFVANVASPARHRNA